MSMMKRHLENEVARISQNTGYDYDFLMDICMEMMESDGCIDLKHIEAVSEEHDW